MTQKLVQGWTNFVKNVTRMQKMLYFNVIVFQVPLIDWLPAQIFTLAVYD